MLAKSHIKPVLCIGESFEEFQAGKTEQKLQTQIQECIQGNISSKDLIIAYEPVWAIGSGDVPTNKYIHEMLSYIKNRLKSLYSTADLDNIKLFYGGSVNANNINELISVELIDGFLIGSASANFEKFKDIVKQIKL